MATGRRVWWAWAAVIVLAALAGLEYGWGARTEILEPYYAATVRSMAGSWHDFAYGAFDPSGTVTVDKLPGAFWLQALSVRLFGVHVWAVIAPQVAEGVLTVLFLYRAVDRFAGPLAGVAAAAVLVGTPANVALDRGNISDSLLVLLAVLAADAAGRAVTGGRWWPVLESGLWVGLAFQAKMAQAWLVLLPVGITYLVLGPGRVLRRAAQLTAGAILSGVVSLAWMTWVSLQPAAGRPFVDGSTDNSVWAQVFQYNGLARFGGGGLLGPAGTPTAAAANLVGGGILNFTVRAPSGWHRLLAGAEGRDIAWLVPAAVIAGIAVLVSEGRRRPLLSAGAVLWLVWLIVHLGVFSWATSINAYYPVMITPALAGLCGMGVSLAWQRRTQTRTPQVLALVIAGTAVYAAWLLDVKRVPTWTPVLVVVLAAAAIVVWFLMALRGRADRTHEGELTDSTGRDRIFAVALLLTLAAGLAAPVASGLWLVGRNLGPFDTPYEPEAVEAVLQSAALQDSSILSFTINSLSRFDQGTSYLFATHSALVAAPFIFASGREVLPIGGFTGLAPEPTVAELSADVSAGRLRFVLANPSSDPRIRWVTTHCRSLTTRVPGQPAAPLGLYLCSP